MHLSPEEASIVLGPSVNIRAFFIKLNYWNNI